MPEFPWALLTVFALLYLFTLIRGIRNGSILNPFVTRMTGAATVAAKRVVYKSGYRYYILFSLGGPEIELKTSEEVYFRLKEGSTGTLVWYGHSFESFEEDVP